MWKERRKMRQKDWNCSGKCSQKGKRCSQKGKRVAYSWVQAVVLTTSVDISLQNPVPFAPPMQVPFASQCLSNQSLSSRYVGELPCKCGIKAAIKITQSDVNGNRGRPYYTCGFSEGGGKKKCEFFKWCDNAEYNREFGSRRDSISGTQCPQRLEAEVAELKLLVQHARLHIKDIERLEHGVAELKLLVQQARQDIKDTERLRQEVAELKLVVQQGREAVKLVENENGWIKMMGVVVFFVIVFFFQCIIK
ncbi:uncharacterized protein LOC143857449 [Tasmannia lanceolata]|uniref:uncharacterized protein LOC143857449 n=1 Tax=Tasmannia lanceolata TaxID=3420 RepID=UPI004064BECA